MKKFLILTITFSGVIMRITELELNQPTQISIDLKQKSGKLLESNEEISNHYRPIYQVNKKLADKLAHRAFVASELQCLTDNIYQEAALEPPEGMLAVATVTMNRVHDPDYPKTVCGVVYERHLNHRNHKVTCQFSWTCKHRGRIIQSKYAEAREVARQAFLKHSRIEELEGVELYHADYIAVPDWAEKAQAVRQIGHHIFYKEIM